MRRERRRASESGRLGREGGGGVERDMGEGRVWKSFLILRFESVS